MSQVTQVAQVTSAVKLALKSAMKLVLQPSIKPLNSTQFVTVLTLFLLIFFASSALAKPQRIISLAPHITELLYTIGAGENLVGVSDYSDYPEQALNLPRVASYAGINLEAIIALKPDLIIAWQQGNAAADIKRLRQFGFTVEMSSPVKLDDIANELIQIGQLTGYTEQAESKARDFKQQLTALRQQYQQSKPLRVFFTMSTNPLSSVANNAWPQQMLTVCAAENIIKPSAGDYPLVGIEQVVIAQPEVIIQADKIGVKQEYWLNYRQIPAVEKQQFLAIDPDYLFRMTPRSLLGIKQLCYGLDAYR